MLTSFRFFHVFRLFSLIVLISNNFELDYNNHKKKPITLRREEEETMSVQVEPTVDDRNQ